MTLTGTTATVVKGKTYTRWRKKPNRLAVAAVWWLETVCELTGHFEGCLLLNSYRAGRPGRAWHRVWVRLNVAADEFTEWERAS